MAVGVTIESKETVPVCIDGKLYPLMGEAERELRCELEREDEVLFKVFGVQLAWVDGLPTRGEGDREEVLPFRVLKIPEPMVVVPSRPVPVETSGIWELVGATAGEGFVDPKKQ